MSEEEVQPEEEAEERVGAELVEGKEEEVEGLEAPSAAEAVEEEEEIGIEYDISDPALLDVMLNVTDLLEKVAKGVISISEAKAEYNLIVQRLSDAAKKKIKKKASAKKKSGGSKRRKKKSSGRQEEGQ